MSIVHLGTGGSSVFSSGAGGTLSAAAVGSSECRGSSNGASDMGSGSRGLESGAGTSDVVSRLDVVVVDISGCESAKGGLVESVLKGGIVSSCETGGRPGDAPGGWS